MKLLIYEHISAGGYNAKAVLPSVFCEGFGMLRTFIEDAKSAGNTITTLLDKKIADFNPPLKADCIIAIESAEEAEEQLLETAENADATFVIAPETNRTLQKLVEKIEQNHTLTLNSKPEAISVASNKTLLQQHARSIGLATPETATFNVKDESASVIRVVKEKIGFPAVFKPVDREGCEALSLAGNEKQAEAAISKIGRSTASRFMAQRLICGIAASVTLISNGTDAQPITLNDQNVSLETPSQESSYNGGNTPLQIEQETSAFVAAKKLVESIHGLKGYIGVDLVLTKDEPVIIEVNPRLTTSYIGIRKVLKLNLAQTISDSILEHKLPAHQQTTGYANFRKVETPNPTNTVLQQTFKVPEVVSPPFPTTHEKHAFALICAHGLTPQQAKCNFGKVEKHLQTILSSGGES